MHGGALPPRRVLYGAAAFVLAIAAVSALLLGKGGGHAAGQGASVPAAGVKPAAAVPSVRVRAPGASAARASGTSSSGVAARSGGAGASAAGGHTGGAAGGGAADGAVAGGRAVAEVRDPEESKSFPVPASTQHAAASTPAVAGEAVVAAGAASDAQIRKELGEEARATAAERAGRAGSNPDLTPVAGGFSVGGNGTIPIPRGVPEAVQRVVAGGNAIADFPYIWGGGHASFVASGYDCSGSVSYALAAGGLLNAPLVSGELASWGAPGPGRWITIYANAGHTFMDVDGWWFDTAGRSGPYASRWLVSTPSLAGYAVRHPVGY
jgi:cell wall-associated NlpC family hydrolase